MTATALCPTDVRVLRLALPKGRMQESVLELLEDAGIDVQVGERAYRPAISVAGSRAGLEAKLLKSQNVVEMLAAGSRDLGFAGADWARELGAELVELLDTGLDPVRIVAAAPRSLLVEGRLPDRPLVVASEYRNIANQWIEQRGLNATFIHTFGATEVFPPEDADVIVDNTATGQTLQANGLAVVDELMCSSTRLFAHPKALEDRPTRERIDDLLLLFRSVLSARQRVMLEVNVAEERLEAVIEVLPAMREPTVAPLHGARGFAVRAAVPVDQVAYLIPAIKARGGTDVVVTRVAQILA